MSVYKICSYVPESHLEPVKQALFAAGAGRIGDYQHCCWQVKGEGQFMPQAGAEPFIGQPGALSRVAEYRIELVCADEVVRDVVTALKQAHPYDQPAYDVSLCIDI